LVFASVKGLADLSLYLGYDYEKGKIFLIKKCFIKNFKTFPLILLALPSKSFSIDII
jgi:hypothetical protein